MYEVVVYSVRTGAIIARTPANTISEAEQVRSKRHNPDRRVAAYWHVPNA